MEIQESDNQEEADIDFTNENPMKRSLESSLNGDEAIEKRAKLEYGCDAHANGQRHYSGEIVY